MPEQIQSKLPLTDSFEAGYLEFNGVLPLEIAGERLRVAVAGEPSAVVAPIPYFVRRCARPSLRMEVG
jgi:hypothetical protein